MDSGLTAIGRLVRRLDHVAEGYGASIDDQRGRKGMDWAVSAVFDAKGRQTLRGEDQVREVWQRERMYPVG